MSQASARKRPTFAFSSGLIALCIGIAVGGIISWSLLFADLGRLDQLVERVRRDGFTLLAIAAGALALLIPTVWLILYWLLGRAKASLVDTAEAIVATARAAVVQKDADATLAHAGELATTIAAWYSAAATRKQVLAALIGLLAAIGGLATAALLFRQIILLQQQNERIDQQISLLQIQNLRIEQQTIVSDAQRRGFLYSELFDILRDARSDINASGLNVRLAIFTQAATPYWLVEVDNNGSPVNAEMSRSPERGLLLRGMLSLGRRRFERETTFRSADMRNSTIADFDNLIIEDAQYADFSNSTILNVRLFQTDFTGSIFTGANIVSSYFTDVIMAGCVLNAGITDSRFENAIFYGCNMNDLRIIDSSFDRSNFNNTDFSRAQFVGCNSFDQATVAVRIGGDISVQSSLLTSPPVGWEVFWTSVSTTQEIARLRRSSEPLPPCITRP